MKQPSKNKKTTTQRASDDRPIELPPTLATFQIPLKDSIDSASCFLFDFVKLKWKRNESIEMSFGTFFDIAFLGMQWLWSY